MCQFCKFGFALHDVLARTAWTERFWVRHRVFSSLTLAEVLSGIYYPSDYHRLDFARPLVHVFLFTCPTGLQDSRTRVHFAFRGGAELDLGADANASLHH